MGGIMDSYYEYLDEEERKEKEFWKSMGKCLGYLDIKCPNCGRVRVEHWSCGKDVCEKCSWCIQDKEYIDRFSV